MILTATRKLSAGIQTTRCTETSGMKAYARLVVEVISI